MRPASGAWTDRAAVAALALALIAIAAPRVAPFSTDGEAYLDVARNLLAGEGPVQRIVDFWRPAIPDPLGLWPPGYPAAVATIAALGISPETAARAAPAIAFVVFALAFHAFARRLLGRGAALATTALALATPGVTRAATTAWSEMPFMALVALGLLGLGLLVDAGGAEPNAPTRVGPVSLALAAGLAIGLAAITRTIGLVLVPFGFAVLAARRVSWWATAPWLLAAALPPAAWALRNVAVFGNPLGPGLPPSDRSMAEIALQLVAALRWGMLPAPLATNVYAAAAGLLAVAAAWAWFTTRRALGLLAGGSAGIMLAALATARARVTINDINDRFLTPAYPWLWLALAVAIAALVARHRWSRPIAVVLAAAALVASGWTLARAFGEADRAARAARASEVAELRDLLWGGGGTVLSEAGHRVRSATDRSAIQIPSRPYRRREFEAGDEARWRGAGCREIVLRRDAPDRAASLGTYLDARLSEGVDWAPADSGATFVVYRLR